LLTIRLHYAERLSSWYSSWTVRFDQSGGVFWEATVAEAVDIVWSYISQR